MRFVLLLLPLAVAACVAGSGVPPTELPPPGVSEATITPHPTSTFAPTLVPTATVVLPTATSLLTQTSAPAVAATASGGGTAAPAAPAIPTASPATTTSGVSAHVYSAPIIIANYMAWYDSNSWATGCTSDSPAAGAYQSDDTAIISRQVAEARRAGLDGFSVHWGKPGDRTDSNLSKVLGQGFGATVTFLNHFFYGTASRSSVAASLTHIINTHTPNSNWIRYAGKPVIFFADMGRIDTSGGLTPQQAWESVRGAVDPNRNTIWIAEGLDPSYLKVFDGLYVYRIDHACCPYAYQNAGKWNGWVRDAEKLYGARYWVATIQPGWDDSRTTSQACNGVRLSATPFARDRESGAYYQRTVNSALASTPDMIIVNSFNEWVEGSFIEPSAAFGDLYLTLTAQYAAQFKGSR